MLIASRRSYLRCSLKREEEEQRALEEEARMSYMTEYLLHRISMPDENGDLLQPDLLQPGVVRINPRLSAARDDAEGDGNPSPSASSGGEDGDGSGREQQKAPAGGYPVSQQYSEYAHADATTDHLG